MRKSALWISGALVLVMGTAGVAMARGDHDGKRGHRGPNFEQMFERIDANNDGKITQEEVDAAAAKRFSDADANGDGQLSAEEMKAHAETEAAKRATERRAARVDRMIERLDENGDGQLSAEEAAKRGPGDMFERMLSRLDADEDGAISREEMQEARGRMKDRDHRGHGKRGGGWWND